MKKKFHSAKLWELTRIINLPKNLFLHLLPAQHEFCMRTRNTIIQADSLLSDTIFYWNRSQDFAHVHCAHDIHIGQNRVNVSTVQWVVLKRMQLLVWSWRIASICEYPTSSFCIKFFHCNLIALRILWTFATFLLPDKIILNYAQITLLEEKNDR